MDRYKQGHINGSRSAGGFLWQAQKAARTNAGCLAGETLQFAHGTFPLRLGEAVCSFHNLRHPKEMERRDRSKIKGDGKNERRITRTGTEPIRCKIDLFIFKSDQRAAPDVEIAPQGPGPVDYYSGAKPG